MSVQFNIIIEDISTARTDAIINPTDRFFSKIIGTNSVLYDAAGQKLQECLENMGEQVDGTAVLTDGYDLNCNKIVHLIGPSGTDNSKVASSKLRNAYKSAFQLLKENNFKTFALSELSDSIYGLYYEDKLLILVEELSAFLSHSNFFGEISIFCKAKKGFNSLKLFLEDKENLQPYLYDLLKTFRNKQTRLANSLAEALGKEELLNKQLLIANAEINKQKEEITIQRDLISNQKKDLSDSIRYALRIQSSLLADQDILKPYHKDYFIFFKPKDVLSGDFYWLGAFSSNLIFVAADCTGHGVPGSLVSMLGITFLDEIIKSDKLISPGDILTRLRKKLIKAFKTTNDEKIKDGMEIAIVSFNFEIGTLTYAAANHPLYLFKDKEFFEYKPDRISISSEGKSHKYENQVININHGDSFYIFSDGFQDQYGGPNKKKFLKARLKNLLHNIQSYDIQQQKDIIENEFRQWKGEEEQTDDVLIIGVRF
jgi:serine phosphatase RsbU (regulator of sigma subunit)